MNFVKRIHYRSDCSLPWSQVLGVRPELAKFLTPTEISLLLQQVPQADGYEVLDGQQRTISVCEY